MKLYAFPKAEHLCLKRDIEALFSAGSRAATAFPLRAVFRLVPRSGDAEPAVKVLLSVSKRRLRHAVDRNRAKRQLREAYRLRKTLLTAALPATVGLHVALLWLADRPVPSATVAESVERLLRRIAEKSASCPAPSSSPCAASSLPS